MADLPEIDVALDWVLARARRLTLEDVPVEASAGRVLGEAARAATDLPPFDSSAMDGFAVRAADTPGALTVVGESAAGSPSAHVLGEREAIAISTGAVVPQGADAVVPVERTTGNVVVERVEVGAHVRPRGGDIRAGDLVLAAGTEIRAPQLAALAAAGIPVVRCARVPRVAVLSTGTELRRPGDGLGPGEIYESNALMLAAQLAHAGAEPFVLDAVPDDEGALRSALEHALEQDVVITSGGVSVGPHDLVRATLAELGAEEVFWRVAVKPGKPVAFAVRGETLVFGLPGNPVSSLVGFELFVRPALAALRGSASPRPAYRHAALAASVRRDPGRDELMRARFVDGALEPITGQDSHMIARAALAEALVRIPHGEGELAAGTQVGYLSI
jgi:molybdopterin molybdotransferase